VDLVVIFMMIFGMVLVLVFVLLVLFCFERHILKNRLEEKKKNSCIKWIVCFAILNYLKVFDSYTVFSIADIIIKERGNREIFEWDA
jgi:heme/copper-type cytochrome/quinol oxidase subunit 2